MRVAAAEVALPGLMTTLTEVEPSMQDKLRAIEATEALKRSMLTKGSGGGCVALCIAR